MALSKEQIRQKYPLPVYNYRVAVQGEGKAPTISFAEVSGLSLEYEPVTYKHGLSFLLGSQIIPGMRQPIRLTLRTGIVAGNAFLQSWLAESHGKPLSKIPRCDVVIDLCNASGKAVVRWMVLGALPTKLDAPGLTADANDVAIETLELVAHGLTMEHLAGCLGFRKGKGGC